MLAVLYTLMNYKSGKLLLGESGCTVYTVQCTVYILVDVDKLELLKVLRVHTWVFEKVTNQKCINVASL